MTPAELSLIAESIVSQLSDIVSFFLGGLTGIAFVLSAKIRWF